MLKIESKHTLFHGTERSRELGVEKLSQGIPAGSNLNTKASTQGYSYMKGFDGAQGLVNNAILMQITYLPTLGGGAGEWYASEAFLKMYNAVCGSAYTTTTFNRADLEMHIMAGEGFLTALDTIDRMLDIYACNEFENLGIRNLHKACGFSNSYNSIQFATLVAFRNRLVTKYNKLLIPANIPAVDRHRALCRHIYADDVHDKTQFIVFRPYVFYTSINNAGTQLCPSSAWTSVKNMSQYLETFIAAIESDLDRYLQSSFFDDISPYLWRAFIDPHGPQVAKVYTVEQYNMLLPPTDTTVIYDSEVSQLVRNAQFVGLPVNVRNNHTGAAQSHINFFEDSDGVLRQGQLAYTTSLYIDGLGISPLLLVYNATPGAGLLPDAIDAQDLFSNSTITKAIFPSPIGDRLINLEDFPSSTDTLFTAMSGQITIQKMNATSKNLYNIRACGDILFLFMSVWFSNASWVDTNSENDLYERDLVVNYATVTPGSTNEKWSNYVFKAYDVLNSQIAAYQSYFCCPIIHEFETDWDEVWEKLLIIDVDNIVKVPYSSLVTYWTYDAYDRFNMASSSNRSEDKSIRKSNNKTYHRVTKKQVNNPKADKASDKLDKK